MNIEIKSVEKVSYGTNAAITVVIDGNEISGNKYLMAFDLDAGLVKFGNVEMTVSQAQPIIDAINSILEGNMGINPENPGCLYDSKNNKPLSDACATELAKLQNEEYFDFAV